MTTSPSNDGAHKSPVSPLNSLRVYTTQKDAKERYRQPLGLSRGILETKPNPETWKEANNKEKRGAFMVYGDLPESFVEKFKLKEE